MSRLEERILTEMTFRETFLTALYQLPSHYERLIVVLWLLGWTQRDIADVYGVSQSMIYLHISKFKQVYKQEIE